MKIDLTLQITPKLAADAQGNEKKALAAHTYPMNYAGVSGLPCRVVAEI